MKKIVEEDNEAQTKVEKLMEVTLGDLNGSRKILVGTQLTDKDRRQLGAFLKDNQDVFAWSYKDIPGINLDYMYHELNIKK